MRQRKRWNLSDVAHTENHPNFVYRAEKFWYWWNTHQKKPREIRACSHCANATSHQSRDRSDSSKSGAQADSMSCIVKRDWRLSAPVVAHSSIVTRAQVKIESAEPLERPQCPTTHSVCWRDNYHQANEPHGNVMVQCPNFSHKGATVFCILFHLNVHNKNGRRNIFFNFDGQGILCFFLLILKVGAFCESFGEFGYNRIWRPRFRLIFVIICLLSSSWFHTCKTKLISDRSSNW